MRVRSARWKSRWLGIIDDLTHLAESAFRDRPQGGQIEELSSARP